METSKDVIAFALVALRGRHSGAVDCNTWIEREFDGFYNGVHVEIADFISGECFMSFEGAEYDLNDESEVARAAMHINRLAQNI